ncbi:DNA-binding response regulator [Alteromonas sp. KUL42]|nr:DNA-binding response regulator [Alteromonas sp. KUL42]
MNLFMNILLVDDHSIVREGFSSLLSSVLENTSVSSAKSAHQATQLLRKETFDLIILDINLASSSGLTLAEYIIQRWTSAKILMFSMFDDISIIDRAIKLGAMGYVSKQSEPEVLINAVTAVLKGRRYLEHTTAIELATFNLSRSSRHLKDLTQRELDIFMGVARGQSRKDVADSLSISEKTVSNVITQLKRKLDLQTNAEFVHLAIKQGYLKIPMEQ